MCFKSLVSSKYAIKQQVIILNSKFIMASSRIPCSYAKCKLTFSRQKEVTRHNRDHDMKEGRLNPFACEVCSEFFVRIDHLNSHQRSAHRFTRAMRKSSSNKPLIGVLYKDSYKIIPYGGCVSKRKTVTIVGLSQELGTYEAVFKCHQSTLSIYQTLRWRSADVGKPFSVTSVRETCTFCAVYFNSAQNFKEHICCKDNPEDNTVQCSESEDEGDNMSIAEHDELVFTVFGNILNALS
jgi:hypothetical protein